LSAQTTSGRIAVEAEAQTVGRGGHLASSKLTGG
jgi:hypothetical protein